MTDPCPSCQSTDLDLVGKHEVLNQYRCRNCGLTIAIFNQPIGEDMATQLQPPPPSFRCKVCRRYTAYRNGVPCIRCQHSPPLFRGGQGRSDKDIEDSAYAIFWCAVFGIIAIGITIFLVCCSSSS